MKFKLFLLAITPFVTFGLVHAYVDCRDTVAGCTITQLVDLGDTAPTTKEDRINAYKAAIAKINVKITELSTVQTGGSVSNKSCLTLKNNLWIGKTDNETDGEVTLLQRHLINGGYLQLANPSGYYGNATAQAVVRMQRALGMDFVTVSSGVGQVTKEKIKCQPQTGVSVKWDMGAKIDTITSDAVVTLRLPGDVVRTAHVAVNSWCKELNQQTLNDEQIKKTKAASVFDKEVTVIKPGLACVDSDFFSWFGVFFENGKYFIKKLNEDASGLGKEKWEIVKEI